MKRGRDEVSDAAAGFAAPVGPAGSVSRQYPQPAAVLELFKPVTWFPPMWAFACGVVSSGVALDGRWLTLILGVVLAGPMVCATSQAVNDWYDRHVDAINEPNRPIPSGRIPGRWGLAIAILWTVVSLLWSMLLGVWVFAAAALGLLLAWGYSAPPARFKQNGWIGNAACGISYEGLAWFTGAAVMLGALPDTRIIVLAALYSLGAHGIMTLNDFKSIKGDRAIGVRSLPARYGADVAAQIACAVMIVAQIFVVAVLVMWGLQMAPLVIVGLIAAQMVMMRHFLGDPVARALWLSAFGIPLFVTGMMVSAFAVAPLVSAGGL